MLLSFRIFGALMSTVLFVEAAHKRDYVGTTIMVVAGVMYCYQIVGQLYEALITGHL